MNNRSSLFTHKKIFLLGILSLVAVAVIAVIFSANKRVSAAEIITTQAVSLNSLNNYFVTAKIELVKPVSVETILTTGEKYSVKEMVLQSNFSLNNEEIQDFYVVDTKDRNKDVKADYVKNRKAFIADLRGLDTKVFNLQDIENILVTKFTITGKKDSVDGMTKGLNASKIDIANTQVATSRVSGNVKPKEAHLSSGDGTVSIAALTTTPMYLSVPNSGT